MQPLPTLHGYIIDGRYMVRPAWNPDFPWKWWSPTTGKLRTANFHVV